VTPINVGVTAPLRLDGASVPRRPGLLKPRRHGIAVTFGVQVDYQDKAVINRIVAMLGMLQVSGRAGTIVASDLFRRGTAPGPMGTNFDEFEAFLSTNRVIRWEDELVSFLDAGAVTVTGVKKAAQRHHKVMEFLAERRKLKKSF
jgi:hypothetical protein